jgi:hypothetical protein
MTTGTSLAIIESPAKLLSPAVMNRKRNLNPLDGSDAARNAIVYDVARLLSKAGWEIDMRYGSEYPIVTATATSRHVHIVDHVDSPPANAHQTDAAPPSTSAVSEPLTTASLEPTDSPADFTTTPPLSQPRHIIRTRASLALRTVGVAAIVLTAFSHLKLYRTGDYDRPTSRAQSAQADSDTTDPDRDQSEPIDRLRAMVPDTLTFASAPRPAVDLMQQPSPLVIVTADPQPDSAVTTKPPDAIRSAPLPTARTIPSLAAPIRQPLPATTPMLAPIAQSEPSVETASATSGVEPVLAITLASRPIDQIDTPPPLPAIARARALFATGDVWGARALLQTLADIGNVDGMIELGRTYDPQAWSTTVPRDHASKAIATQWYSKAAAQGSTEAQALLDRSKITPTGTTPAAPGRSGPASGSTRTDDVQAGDAPRTASGSTRDPADSNTRDPGSAPPGSSPAKAMPVAE